MVLPILGYDQQIPINMQGMEIGSPLDLDGMDVGADPDFDAHQLPTPPQDNNQVAAWYDTDL